MTTRKTVAALACAAVIGTGCVDLEVQNPNQADRDRALTSATDVEALVAGSYRQWFGANESTTSYGAILNTMSYMHSATAANFAMVEFSSWPKVATHNFATDAFSGETNNNWTRYYRAVSAIVVGLQTLEDGGLDVSEVDVDRISAYGYFVLGLVHGSAAISYDQAYVYDPTMTVDDVELRPYAEVLAASFSYFDKAIQFAQGKSFTIPDIWIGETTTAAELVRQARSYKARYRAAVARTPAERAAVDWAAVIADIDAGITEDITWNTRVGGPGFGMNLPNNIFRYGPWGQLSYQVLGMADQAGQYQTWISRAPYDRHPNLSADQLSQPFLIQTPDLRFPQGADRTTQTANDGTLFEIATLGGGFASQWARPDRGSFRWSYYRYHAFTEWATPGTNRHDWPEMRTEEMQLLKAEGLFRQGNRAAAATIINNTRVAAGLNATNADGLNTSCVPKLANGSCGDLFEMLKWETRLETMYSGLHMAPWYFHGRGWGDLAQGSFLHLPIPGREAELLLLQPYKFGGTGEASAPVGTYGY